MRVTTLRAIVYANIQDIFIDRTVWNGLRAVPGPPGRADTHIGPKPDGIGVSVFSGRSGVVPNGAMRASPPTVDTSIFS